MRTIRPFIFALAAIFIISSFAFAAPQYIQSPPLKDVIRVQIGDVREGGQVTLPLITWGGDIATILANGNSAVTTKGSIFGQKGLNLKLERIDDFKKQVEMYLRGEMPFLRGTMGMINMAAEVTNDPRTKPVIVYQMTWSVGGDCLVVKEGIKTVKDLKGKTIVLQAYGPHVDYMGELLKTAGLTLADVNIKWVKDLTGTDQTPVEAFYSSDVDAAFVIIPDGLMLASNGTVGTGGEGSVKGARIMMSTKTASRIIADVYVVRADYFAAHKSEVEALVHGLMLAEQELKGLFRNKQTRVKEFKALVTASAEILLDSPAATADAEALYGDCEYVGFRGNVKFFGDEKWPRNFAKLTTEIQDSFIQMGLLSTKVALTHAKWNYDQLRTGLTGITDVEAPRFKADEVAEIISRKQATGTLEEGQIFPTLEIFFKPNKDTFVAESINPVTNRPYSEDFDQIVEKAATYGGALFVVEGHSDPMWYLRREKAGAPDFELRRIKQDAKTLSLTRAIRVRDSIIDYAQSKGLTIDPSQLTVIGHGITQPKYAIPRTEKQWEENMRVCFRIIQIEAEASAFQPLD